ncbi:MAG: ROK family protein [Planctomycetaceae bacterium]
MTDEQKKQYWLGFDLGGTKMLAQVFDRQFKPIGKARKKTKASLDADAGLNRVADTIRDALEDAKITAPELLGIGIGCPGPVDMDRGVVLDPPNLGWKNAKVRSMLEGEFSTRVAVLNDVDAGVFGEYRFGAGTGARTVVGVFPGTGIGGGCVYDGVILRGTVHSCMEIGHVQVDPKGPLCGCGRRGCLEAVASRLAIAANAAKAAYRGEAPKLLEIAGTDIADIRSGALAASVAGGDRVVKELVTEAARMIGIAVAGVVHLLAPDVIIIGGGLAESMPEIMVDVVAAEAKKRVMPAFKETFKVVAAKLGDDAGSLGAAAWAEKQFEPEPSMPRE